MTNLNYYDPTTATYLNPSTDYRVAVITGGNSGIGWYTILHLYLHGYAVYILGRSKEKIETAITEIKAEAEKRIAQYSEQEASSRFVGKLDHIYADLTDLKTVDAAAKEFLTREKKLHILINNAGLMAVPYEETKDGYEVQYQVNFVAHMLLTIKLLPALEAVYKETTLTPRVVNVSSLGHNAAYKYFHPSSKLNHFPSFLYTWIRYGNAKSAEIQFTNEFALRHPKILSLSVHPGIVTGTKLYGNYLNDVPLAGLFMKHSFGAVGAVAGVTNEEGSYATLKAALDESLTTDVDNGAYFTTGGVESKPSGIASSRDHSATTWNWNYKNLNNLGFELK